MGGWVEWRGCPLPSLSATAVITHKKTVTVTVTVTATNGDGDYDEYTAAGTLLRERVFLL